MNRGSLWAVDFLHLLYKVCGSEEHAFESFFDIIIFDVFIFIEGEGLEVFLDLVFVFSQFQGEVIVGEDQVHLFSEGPELEG